MFKLDEIFIVALSWNTYNSTRVWSKGKKDTKEVITMSSQAGDKVDVTEASHVEASNHEMKLCMI